MDESGQIPYWEDESAENPPQQVRAGQKYIFRRSGMDTIFNEHCPGIEDGTPVVVTQLPSAPKPGTMGQVHISDARTGEFLGMCSMHSLQTQTDELERSGQVRMVKHNPVNIVEERWNKRAVRDLMRLPSVRYAEVGRMGTGDWFYEIERTDRLTSRKEFRTREELVAAIGAIFAPNPGDIHIDIGSHNENPPIEIISSEPSKTDKTKMVLHYKLTGPMNSTKDVDAVLRTLYPGWTVVSHGSLREGTYPGVRHAYGVTLKRSRRNPPGRLFTASNYAVYEVRKPYPASLDGSFGDLFEDVRGIKVNLASITGGGETRWMVRGDYPDKGDKEAIAHFGLRSVPMSPWKRNHAVLPDEVHAGEGAVWIMGERPSSVKGHIVLEWRLRRSLKNIEQAEKEIKARYPHWTVVSSGSASSKAPGLYMTQLKPKAGNKRSATAYVRHLMGENPPMPMSSMVSLTTARTMMREIASGERPVAEAHQAAFLIEAAMRRLMASHPAGGDRDYQNPPAAVEKEIYRDIVEIKAIKPDGKRYVHKFGKGSNIYGMSDGTILIRSRKGKRLWKNFKVEG